MTKTISYKLTLIDSTSFMASSLSNVVDNLEMLLIILLKEFIKFNVHIDMIYTELNVWY